MKNRVVVTGLGAVTPLGVGAEPLFERWVAGECGISDGEGRCRDFEPTDFLSIKEARRADRFTQLALAAADEAIRSAGWEDDLPFHAERVGCVLGTGIGGLGSLEEQHLKLLELGPKRVSPLAVPLLMGTAKTEATFYFAGDARHMKLSVEQVKARLKEQFAIDDEKAESMMAAFRRDEPGRTPSDVLVALITNALFRGPMLAAAEAKANAGQAPVWLYNFVWRAPVDGGIWGSPHAIDIPFAFGNTDKATSLVGTGPEPAEVSRNLMSAFVAFARTGKPNNPRMPEWKPFDPSSRATMTIDVKPQLVNDYLSGDRAAAASVKLDPFNRSALMTYKD